MTAQTWAQMNRWRKRGVECQLHIQLNIGQPQKEGNPASYDSMDEPRRCYGGAAAVGSLSNEVSQTAKPMEAANYAEAASSRGPEENGSCSTGPKGGVQGREAGAELYSMEATAANMCP